MAYEPGVLALIQAGRALLECNVATIAYDATTAVDKHINNFNITTHPSKRNYTISSERLPGGTASDYTAHIVRAIREMASCVAEFDNLPEVDVLDVFMSKLKSCLSDRAPVNSLVKTMLEEEFNIQLIQLFCNVHPVDTFASDSLRLLINLDKDFNLKPFKGTDGVAVTIIKNVSKLRYSYKGEPAALKSFLKENGVAPGLFLRYVGNRLHVLFHMAGVIFSYRELLLNFLESNAKNETSKALFEDLKKEVPMLQLQALGLIGKLITGPWMTVVYKSVTGKSNLEMSKIFQTVERHLHLFKSDPESMLSTDEDVFGQPLNIDEDRIHQSLLVVTNKDILVQILTSQLPVLDQVLQRQMKQYMSGDLAQPSEELLVATQSVPPHNIQCERNLGLMDFLIRRAPNATIGYLNSKVNAKINHTLEWLDEQPLALQEKLIRFSVKRGAMMENQLKVWRKRLILRLLTGTRKPEKEERKKSENVWKKMLQKLCRKMFQ